MPNREAFNAAFGSLGYDIGIADLDGQLEGQSGFMPMRLFGEESGVEFDVFEGRETVEELEPDANPGLDRVASFRWGASFEEGFLAFCGAATIAQLTGGAIVDEYEGLVSIDAAITTAKSLLAERSRHTG